VRAWRKARRVGWAGRLDGLSEIAASRGRGDWCVCGHHRATHLLGSARCRLNRICGCQLYRRSEVGDIVTRGEPNP
jgi:hypothetical protein